MANTLSDLLRSRRNVGFSGMQGDLVNAFAGQDWQSPQPITNESLGYQPYPTSKPQNNYSRPQESNQSSNAISMMMMANQGGNRPEYTTRQLGSHEQNWDYGVKDQYGMSDINRSQQVNVGDGMVGYVQPDGRVIAQDNSGAYFEATSNANQNRMFQGLQQSMQAKLERDYQQALKREDEQRNQQAAKMKESKLQFSEAQTKPMTADQEAKFLERWSKDYKEVEGAKSSAQEIAKAAKQVREAKGLSGATGIQAYIPSYPGSEASQAEVDIETLKGKVTSMGKALMSASGSIGPMAIQEWKIVSDAVAALDPKKLSPEKLKQQIGLIESQAVGMAERFNDVYGRQYQDYYEKYPQMRMGQQQYGNSGDDSAAIAWAKANPNDPRAVKIMSLHGR